MATLLPSQDPIPQIVGPRALAQRRQAAPGANQSDPLAWFTKYLKQYGLHGTEGMAPVANPRTTAEYNQSAQNKERLAAQTRTMRDKFTAFGISDPTRLGAVDELTGEYENAAALSRLGGQVYGGGPGDFTNLYQGWNKAIALNQSLGGTYYSQAGAAQAAAGGAAFLNQARAELSGPLDQATMLNAQAMKRLGGIPGGAGGAAGGYQQTFLRGTARGQSIANKNPLVKKGPPQLSFGGGMRMMRA